MAALLRGLSFRTQLLKWYIFVSPALEVPAVLREDERHSMGVLNLEAHGWGVLLSFR